MKQQIEQWLIARGVPPKTVEELMPLLPDLTPESACGYFYGADYICNPDRWFFWPGQSRFVLVGQCANGDGIALDTVRTPGAVYYVSHEHDGQTCNIDDMTIPVACSPSEFVRRISDSNEFPMDFWEATQMRTEQGAAGDGSATPEP